MSPPTKHKTLLFELWFHQQSIQHLAIPFRNIRTNKLLSWAHMETAQGQDREHSCTRSVTQRRKKIMFLYMTVTQKNTICMYTICKPKKIIIILLLLSLLLLLLLLLFKFSNKIKFSYTICNQKQTKKCMYTIVTKERNQLNIEDYSCPQCNIFVNSGGLGIDFFISFLILNCYNISIYTQHLHFVHSSCQTFLHLQIS